jgi:hypothetical protein
MPITLVLPFLLSSILLQAADTELIEELDAGTARVGYFKIVQTPLEVLGEQDADFLNPVLLSTEPVEWRVYVPRGYDPASPPGVLVFVSSIEWGGIPQEWQPVMEEKNLIWISASNAGSSAPVGERMVKAIIAPRVIDGDYKVDPDRIYIAGFADGGKVANLVQTAEPGVFDGGIYICGALSWADKPPDRLDEMRGNRHVFIRGCFDPRERDVRNVYKDYIESGIEHSKLITIETRRRRLPQPVSVESAIDYLDGAELAPE